MDRRRFIGSAAIFLGLAGCGSARSDIGTIGKNSTPPEGKGVTEMGWRLLDEATMEAEFVLQYGSPAPAFLRLIAPDGGEYFRNEEPPENGEDSLVFSLPIKRVGEWKLATEDAEGNTDTQSFVFNRHLKIKDVSLNRDTLTLSVENAGTVPNIWVSYIIKAGSRVESFEVNQVLSTTRSCEIKRQYPFKHYEGVQIHLFDGIDTHDKSTYDLI